MYIYKMARTNQSQNQKVLELEERINMLEIAADTYDDKIVTMKKMMEMQAQTIDNLNMMMKLIVQQHTAIQVQQAQVQQAQVQQAQVPQEKKSRAKKEANVQDESGSESEVEAEAEDDVVQHGNKVVKNRVISRISSAT